MTTNPDLSSELETAKAKIAELERYITRPTHQDEPPVLCPPERTDALASIYVPIGLADKDEYLESKGKDGQGDAFKRRIWINEPDLSVSEIANGAGVSLNIWVSLGVNHSDHWGLESQMMMSINPDLDVVRAAANTGEAIVEIIFSDEQTSEIKVPLSKEIRSRFKSLAGKKQSLDEDEWLNAVQNEFELGWFPSADLDEDPRRRLVETEISSSWVYWFGWEQ